MDISKDVNYGVDMSVLSGAEIVQVPDSMGEWTHQFQEAMMMYNCAIREVKTRLEVLNDELSVRNKRNPIELIKSRVKRPISIIEKLHGLGYIVEIDDFGSGYSSLNILKDLHVDVIKLDLGFLDGNVGGRGGIILSSVVQMAGWTRRSFPKAWRPWSRPTT